MSGPCLEMRCKMKTYHPTQDLIAKAQDALAFLHQNTECGKITLDIDMSTGKIT